LNFFIQNCKNFVGFKYNFIIFNVSLFSGNFLINVFGYIDPGSLSAFMAVIIGALAGVGMTLKLYWHKIKFKFSK